VLVVAEEFYDGFGAGLDVKFFVNGMEVSADGAQGNAEVVGDFFIEVAFSEKSKDLLFSLREFFDFGLGFLDLLEMVDDLPRDLHGHGCAAGMDLFDCLDELGGRHVFEKVTAGAAAQGIENEVAFLVGGEHEDLDFGKAFFEAGDALDAAHPGEVDVHEDDVGFLGGDSPKGFFAIGMCADATQSGGAAK